MTEADSGHVVSTIDFCRNFPREPGNRLPREQLYELIEKALRSSRIVLLEGEPLSGKTECLADFMRHSPNSCMGVFISADLGAFRSPNYLRLLIAEQAAWITGGETLPDDLLSEERYLQLLYRLQRYAKNQRITWLVDGIARFDHADERISSELIDLIPFGMREFNFVVSCEAGHSNALNLEKQGAKTVPVIPVAVEEATSYFMDMNLEAKDVKEIRQFCAGVIGRMQKCREFLKEGISIDTLLAGKSHSLESLFEFEWSLIPQSEDMRRVLAYVAFSNLPSTIEAIAGFVGKDVGHAADLARSCRILSVGGDGQSVAIESRAQHSFVSLRLSDLKNEVRAFVIARLLAMPTSKDATMFLPNQLIDAGRHSELLQHLGPGHFLNLLETERSLHALRLHAELGIASARALRDSTAELAFALIRSTATGLTFSIGIGSQIEALVRLGSPESAIELAAMAPTVEERLHLSAIAANSLHSNKQGIPKELRESVSDLQKKVAFEDLGDLGIEIACNLLPVDFDLAKAITDRTLEGMNKRRSIGADGRITQPAALGTQGPASNAAAGESGKLTLLHNRLMRRFTDAIVATVGEFSADRILTFIKSLEPQNKIMAMARWLNENRDHSEAFRVAEQALDLILGEISRSPSLRDLREIAEVLPHLKDQRQREALCRRIEVQVDLISHHGTNEEYCRLMLLIYLVRFETDPAATELSLIDLFGSIAAVDDVSVRTTCWTWMLFQISRISDRARLESDTGLIVEVEEKLSQSIHQLLGSTAYHFRAARGAISALAQTSPTRALDLVGRLNTEESRDLGHEELVRRIVTKSADRAAVQVIGQAIVSIKLDDIRNRAVLGVLRMFMRSKDREVLSLVVAELPSLPDSIRVASARLQALTLMLQIRCTVGIGADEEVTYLEEIEQCWSDVLTDNVRVELGYWIASELSSVSPAAAKAWISRTIEFSKARQITSESICDALLTTVSLAAQVLPSLEDASGSGFQRLVSTVQMVPSVELQVQIWTKLAIRSHFVKRYSMSTKVVEEYLKPLLNQSYSGNELVRDSLLAFSAPALYLVHPASALQAVSSMDADFYRDLARVNICEVVLRQWPIGEPFDAPDDHEYKIDGPAVADILAVLRDVTRDSMIYSLVQSVTASLGGYTNQNRIPRTSAQNSLISLQEVIEARLPDKKNIAHEGFLVVCLAHVMRARHLISRGNVVSGHWAPLYGRARAISNIADRVVVSAIVGVCGTESRGKIELGDWIGDVRRDLCAIPSDADRADRYDWVAKIVRDVDKAACRQLLSDGIRLVAKLPETDDIIRRQRSLLDLANSLDSRLVDEMIETCDSDEARRKRFRDEKVRHERMAALTKSPGPSEVSSMMDQELVDACSENLGRLAAGRLAILAVEDLEALHRRASSLPIGLAGPIWKLIYESALRKRGRDRSDIFAAKLFDATCKSSEIVCGLVGHLFSGDDRRRTLRSGIVRDGERDLFLELLVTWARRNEGQMIRISDPYFGPEDMEIIKEIYLATRDTKFRVITSKEHLRKRNVEDVSEEFCDVWRQICDEPLPQIEIAVVGLGAEGKHPIHERWIVSNIAGLRLGTSARSMGSLRTSEISSLDSEEARARSAEIDGFVEGDVREIAGNRISLARFSL